MVLGIVSLLLASLQYRQETLRLDSSRGLFSLPLLVAMVVVLVGVLALMNVLFRVGPF